MCASTRDQRVDGKYLRVDRQRNGHIRSTNKTYTKNKHIQTLRRLVQCLTSFEQLAESECTKQKSFI